MKTWGNWPLDDSLSRHFWEPWIICSVGNPEEWRRMQGFWATKWGYHGNLWENMWIHGRLPIHFLGGVPPLGGRVYRMMLLPKNWRSTTSSWRPEIIEARLKWGYGHLFGLWVIVCEHWVAKNERVCHQENANLWPMGPWPYQVLFFFLMALRQCSAAAGKKVKAGAGGEGGLDDLRSQLGAVQLSYCRGW